MPTQIPPGVKSLREPRLTAIKAITLLAKKDFLNALKDGVKKAMASRHAEFAESEYVVAHLRGGGDSREINPKKLFALTQGRRPGEKGKITLNQYFGCVRPNVEAVEELLGAAEIEVISDAAEGGGSRLYTDWKSGLDIDLNEMLHAMVDNVEQQSKAKGQTNVREKARAASSTARL